MHTHNGGREGDGEGRTGILTLRSNFQMELQPEPGSDEYETFETLDLAFTIFYVLELALNMVAHWFVKRALHVAEKSRL